MADNNAINPLRALAADAILPFVLYQPPEFFQQLWQILGRPTAEWTDEIIRWLRTSDSNFWNQHLPPLPLDNQ